MYRVKGKRAVRITMGITLAGLMLAVAVSLLMAGADGARAFDAGVAVEGSERFANQVGASECVSGGAVSADNTALAADCDILLAAKSTIEGTGPGSLNWASDRNIRQWEGVVSNTGRVTSLDLDRKRLSGTIPASLGSLDKLQDIDFAFNEMTGSIPKELGNLDELWAINMGDNNLTGSIPTELGNLGALTELTLYSNQLSGSIPAKLSEIPNLDIVYLQFNRLTGEIPSEFGGLDKLDDLNLSNNRLTGEIPSELGDMDEISALQLHNNRLTGEIPSELGNPSNLTWLTLRGNNFTGCIPASLRQRLGTSETRESIGLRFCDDAVPTATPTVTPTPSATPETPEPPEPGETVTPTATTVPGTDVTPVSTAVPTATRTTVPTATRPVVSGDVTRRLGTLERQFNQLMDLIRALTSRLAALEAGGGGTGPATAVPTATPSPTPVRAVEPVATATATATSVPTATPSATATPGLTPVPVGADACIERLPGAGSVRGRWTSDCVSPNPPAANPGGIYYARYYTFTLDASSDVDITLSSSSVDPYLLLRSGAGRNGNVVEETDGVRQSFVAINETWAAGTYTIEATSWEERTTGAFTLELGIAPAAE